MVEEFEIKIGEEIRDDLPLGKPPLEKRKFKAWGEPKQDAVRIILGQKAYRQVNRHARSDTNHEVGGALLGKAYRFEGYTYLELVEAIPAILTQSGSGHVTFTPDTWSDLNRRQETEFPDLRIVGWYHTHPRMSIFLSSDDQFLHQSFFPEPWQIALVVEPHKHLGGFFVWRDGVVRPARGFYELFDKDNKSVVNWRNLRSPILYSRTSDPSWMQWTSLAVLMVLLFGICTFGMLMQSSLNRLQRDLAALQATVYIVSGQAGQIERHIYEITQTAQAVVEAQTAVARETRAAQATQTAILQAAVMQTRSAQATLQALDAVATLAAQATATAAAEPVTTPHPPPTGSGSQASQVQSLGLALHYRGQRMPERAIVPVGATIEILFTVVNTGTSSIAVEHLGVCLSQQNVVDCQEFLQNDAGDILPGEEKQFVLVYVAQTRGEFVATAVMWEAVSANYIPLSPAEGYRSDAFFMVR